jgi:hypothetical protein
VPRDTAPLIVRPNSPFRLDLTAWALRRRARNKIDRWDGVTYRRVIAVSGRPTEVAVRQEGWAACMFFRVTMSARRRVWLGGSARLALWITMA